MRPARRCVFTVPNRANVYSDADALGGYVVRVVRTGELLGASCLAAAVELAKIEAAYTAQPVATVATLSAATVHAYVEEVAA